VVAGDDDGGRPGGRRPKLDVAAGGSRAPIERGRWRLLWRTMDPGCSGGRRFPGAGRAGTVTAALADGRSRVFWRTVVPGCSGGRRFPGAGRAGTADPEGSSATGRWSRRFRRRRPRVLQWLLVEGGSVEGVGS
jgi:hypothetical protein